MQEHRTTKPMIVFPSRTSGEEWQTRKIFLCSVSKYILLHGDGQNKHAGILYTGMFVEPEFLTVLHQYKPFFKGRVKRKMNCQFNPVQSIKANKKTEAVFHYQHICNTSTITIYIKLGHLKDLRFISTNKHQTA